MDAASSLLRAISANTTFTISGTASRLVSISLVR